MGKKLKNNTILYYILTAYVFNILLRYILYFQIAENSDYLYNGQIIPIWTPDASLYGYYAKNLLNGITYPFNSEYIPAYLIFYLVKITGFSLEKVLFFTPAFLSSLVVIPIILIANIYKLTKIGFLSMLFGATFVSYYYRTHLGYYDTDVLNIFFPLFSIYFLIAYIHSKSIKYLLFSLISLILFNFWYHSSKVIIASIIIIFIIYIFLFERNLIKKTNLRYIFIFIGLAIILLFFLNMDRVLEYLDKSRDITIQTTQNGTLKFIGALKNVAEAQPIDFQMFVKRVSGNWTYFIISLFGYLALLFKYRSFFLTLPMVFIAFLSLKAGLRFTIYAVPIFSFSLVYGIKLIFDFLLVKWGEFNKNTSNIATTIFIAFITLFTIKNLLDYNLNIKPFYFSNTDDIKALNKLSEVSNPDDFIIAPWDYGWPLWYYANISTIVDNGNGHAEDKYITSKILLSDNKYFTKNASLFFVNKYKENSNSDIIRKFLNEYPISYFNKLKDKNFSTPKIEKKVFILLHKSMLLETYKAIEASSNFNLKNKKEYKSNLYNILFLKKRFTKDSQILNTTTRFKIDLKRGMILSSNIIENAKVKKIVIFNNNKILFNREYNTNNNIYILIYNKKILIMNKKLFNSFLVQALFLNNYDKNLFKEISKSGNLKILKVIP